MDPRYELLAAIAITAWVVIVAFGWVWVFRDPKGPR